MSIKKKKDEKEDVTLQEGYTEKLGSLVEEEREKEPTSLTDESSLVAINIEMLPSHIPLPCSVYIQIAGRYVLFRNQGERLSSKRIMELEQRKVVTLYIHKAFWKLFMDTLENLDLPDATNTEEKAKHIKNLLVAYGQELDKKFKEPKKPMFDRLRNYCEKLAEQMMDNRELGFKLLRKNTDPVLYFINHSVNVAVYSCLIGLQMKMSVNDLKMLTYGGLVHDIGNLYLPKRLLYKGGNLTEEEELELQTHTRSGAELLQTVGAPPAIVLMALQHHERFDGDGYPSGLEAEDIHQYARICTVADTFDNLTSKRPASEPVGSEQAVSMMKEMAGAFDPKILEQVTHEELSSEDYDDDDREAEKEVA